LKKYQLFKKKREILQNYKKLKKKTKIFYVNRNDKKTKEKVFSFVFLIKEN
jgi:hypothetical protein